MKETRKRLGKLHAEGKTPHYRGYYLEFKEEIDAELNPPEPASKIKKKKEE